VKGNFIVMCGSNGISVFIHWNSIWRHLQSFDGMSGELDATIFGSYIIVSDPKHNNDEGRILSYIYNSSSIEPEFPGKLALI